MQRKAEEWGGLFAALKMELGHDAVNHLNQMKRFLCR